MVKVNSSRAQKILEAPRYLKKEVGSSMRKFPGSGLSLWVELENEGPSVKNLSYSGALDSIYILIFESMASLLVGKKLNLLETLSVRECEAFLRDRNSEAAFEGWSAEEEKNVQAVFQWLRAWPLKNSAQSYQYSAEKGPFRQLKLADKVRELKAFLSSQEMAELYQSERLPELVDVEELTVYVQVPYATEAHRARFQELHERGVEIFNEDELNFIPEA
jgi:hypothetical protein